jgi:uncharacterized protein (DUF488 family)
MTVSRILTIGHSTRTLAEFLLLLQRHGATGLADVRTIPRSRRHPHFAGDALAVSLPIHGIAYQHFPGLGGLRKPRRDSPNGAWREPGFRGYADHMQSSHFAAALDDLLAFASDRLVAIMCAESKWWQCHRQLISDALVIRGIEVCHVMSPNEATRHSVTSFARVSGTSISYPALV